MDFIETLHKLYVKFIQIISFIYQQYKEIYCLNRSRQPKYPLIFEKNIKKGVDIVTDKDYCISEVIQ